MTHTPGPWVAEWFTDTMHESWWWVNFNPNGPEEDRSRVGDHILVDKANAHLIAAAPDLLAALVRIMDEPQNERVSDEALIQASAAIVKATS